MKAGKTNFTCNTHVRITKINSSDPDDQKLVGVTGTVTHPFPGLMSGSSSKYIAGIWIDGEFQHLHGKETNLCVGDEIELFQPMHYVDVKVRLRIKADTRALAEEIPSLADYNFAYDGEEGLIDDTEVTEVEYVGRCDDRGILLDQ